MVSFQRPSSAPAMVSSIARNIEGTVERMETSPASTRFKSAIGSCVSVSLKICTRPPNRSGPKNCQTELSKHWEAICASVSEEVSCVS